MASATTWPTRFERAGTAQRFRDAAPCTPVSRWPAPEAAAPPRADPRDPPTSAGVPLRRASTQEEEQSAVPLQLRVSLDGDPRVGCCHRVFEDTCDAGRSGIERPASRQSQEKHTTVGAIDRDVRARRRLPRRPSSTRSAPAGSSQRLGARLRRRPRPRPPPKPPPSALIRERQSNSLGPEPQTGALGRARQLDDHAVLIPHHRHTGASRDRRLGTDSHVIPRKVLELLEV